eukprot:TRINITY_DN1427_c0_g2_i2.p1 TRINITY_DN1427_c0_g2~~TRINITY_DN1427_c0_g2_i2.p1  ORF type:complete len:221 (+),score=34.52 TRINITY_DN1427_c0_g2_i2:326-988(+)
MCQSTASFGGRNATAEGFETKLVLHAYSRALLAHYLLPLMARTGSNAETATPEGPRILSVLSGGVHDAFRDITSDPDLENTFSLKRAADAGGYYNDLILDLLAKTAPAQDHVGLLHACPGFVATKWGHQTVLAPLIKILQKVFARTATDCGRIMTDALMMPAYRSGFHMTNQNGKEVPPSYAKSVPADIFRGHQNALRTHFESVFTRALGPGWGTLPSVP